MRVACAEAGEDVELTLDTLLLVVKHEVVVAASDRCTGEPACHHRLILALAEPAAGLGIDHQELVVESGGEAACPRGDVVAADGPAVIERIFYTEVRRSGHPEEGVALESEEEFLTLRVHRLVVSVGHRLDAEKESGRDRRTDVAEVQKGDLRLGIEACVLAYVVDGLEAGVDAVMESVTRSEIDSGLVYEVETIELVVAVGVVGDVEDVVRLESHVLDDGVVDHRLAEEVLAPVAVRQ